MPPRVTGDKVLLLSESAMIPAPVSLVVVNRIGVSAPVRSLACSVPYKMIEVNQKVCLE